MSKSVVLQKVWQAITFDLYIWPLTLKDDLDLDTSPLFKCDSMRYTCMTIMKSPSLLVQKLYDQCWSKLQIGKKKLMQET